MSFAVVACDLDGTLLRSDGTLSDRTRRALAAVHAAGATVVACTARPVRWVQPLAAEWDGASVAICANGAVTWDLEADCALSELALEIEIVHEVIEVLTGLFPGGAWAVERTHGFGHEPAYHPRWPTPSDTAIAAIAELLSEPPIKLMFRHEGLSPDVMLPAARAALAGRVELSHSNSADGLLEISAAGVDKGSAVARLCAAAGFGPEQVIAFGDMPNDLSLLRWAGTAVAVANAHPDVLAIADQVTAGHDDDGVARVLEREFVRPVLAARRRAGGPDVLLVTGSAMPRADDESTLVLAALAARGVEAGVYPWDSGHDFARAGLVVNRSPWDYVERLPEFLAWAETVAAATALENPLEVLRWNAHKSYLLDLARAGVPIVPTELLAPGADVTARRRALRSAGGAAGAVVIKPAVGSGARGALRAAAGTPDTEEHLRRLLSSGHALVQPYLPAVADGEASLIFIDGGFSHAVIKTPQTGEYRVHLHHGGVVAAYTPTDVELAVARAALAVSPAAPLYARIDLIGRSQPLVMEAELIEPELFLPGVPGAVERFTDAIAARLG